MAIYWPTPGYKGRTFKLCVLTRWDFNFCIHSSPLRKDKRHPWPPFRGTKQNVCSFLSDISSTSYFVSWCFEPSQPQRITSGLNTDFSPSPSYSVHKSLYHKSFFFQTTAQILSTILEHKTRKTITHILQSIYNPRVLNTEPASSRLTYFILQSVVVGCLVMWITLWAVLFATNSLFC